MNLMAVGSPRNARIAEARTSGLLNRIKRQADILSAFFVFKILLMQILAPIFQMARDIENNKQNDKN